MNSPAPIARVPGRASPDSAPRVGSGDVIDMRAALRALWRRKWVVTSSALVVVVAVLLVVANQTPLYTASATLMLNTRQSNVVDVAAVLSGLPADASQALNEVEVLQSGRLIGRVIDRLQLDRDPEFDGGAAPTGLTALVARVRERAQDLLGGADEGAGPPLSEEERGLHQRERLVSAVRDRLAVSQIRRSLAIEASFTSTSPQKAALIANAFAEEYLVDQLEAKFEATQRATSWLNDRLGVLKEQVAASEAAVEAFKATQGVGAAQGAAITAQQLTQLNGELVMARAKRAEAEARYDRLAEVLKQRGAAAAADAISSPLIVSLRQQLADLKRREAELATRYTAKHPTMINLKAEISDAAEAISAEVRKVVAGLKTELDVAQSREATLAESVEALEDDSLSQDRSSVALRQLEREAEANRLIYESFLSRFKETEEQDGLQQADAQLITRAQAPDSPSYPNRTRSLLYAAFGGIALGGLLAFLLEHLDNAYRSARQIETDLGLATLGAIPRMQGRRTRRAHLDHVLAKPASVLAEAVRSLRSALFLSNVDAPPRVIAVASSLPEEGKTTVSLLLAQTLARLGRSVLLVECDLRRPTLSQVFGADPGGPGLVELLAGEAEPGQAVRRDAASGVDYVASRPTAANAADLLSSQRFADLVAAFRARYDAVVLDAPPTLAVSDSVPIAKQADAVLFVVKWNGAPREAVQAGVRALTDRGIAVDGVVFTQVDLAAQGRYGYGEAAGYYGRCRGYYQR